MDGSPSPPVEGGLDRSLEPPPPVQELEVQELPPAVREPDDAPGESADGIIGMSEFPTDDDAPTEDSACGLLPLLECSFCKACCWACCWFQLVRSFCISAVTKPDLFRMVAQVVTDRNFSTAGSQSAGSSLRSKSTTVMSSSDLSQGKRGY